MKELQSWEAGLDNLLRRAEAAQADAENEIQYIERLEQFICVSKELREAFRSFVIRQSPSQFISNLEDPSDLAQRFAPTGSESLRQVANGSGRTN